MGRRPSEPVAHVPLSSQKPGGKCGALTDFQNKISWKCLFISQKHSFKRTGAYIGQITTQREKKDKTAKLAPRIQRPSGQSLIYKQVTIS